MRKQYILYIAVITTLFGLIITIDNNSNNVSALDYSGNVGIGFTFNPTLSINISSSDLVISNLKPGTTEDSNSINVSVTTNASYGYTLSANVGDDIHNNSNLTHTNNIDMFSSIAIDADLASLDDSEDSNIWGYSYKNNTVVSPAWSNYNGLSNSSNAILLDNSNAADSTGGIDFKIGAKAGNVQPSGEYTGTINFTAVSKVAPMSLLDSFIASGAEQLNGYYKMQDMTHDICNNVDVEESELQLIDVRDNKVYWVAKLKDGNCWMTQNLDLDLDSNRTYTHWDTDLGWETLNESVTWQPINSTINTISKWQNSYTEPYSADLGNIYYYTSNSDATDIKYNSLDECLDAEHSDCDHYHAGNYYNYPAALAGSTQNSICPKGWKLPGLYAYRDMLEMQGIYNGADVTYSDGGFTEIRTSPVYLVRSGGIYNQSINGTGATGFYHISYSGYGSGTPKRMSFGAHSIRVQYGDSAGGGISIRCLAR